MLIDHVNNCRFPTLNLKGNPLLVLSILCATLLTSYAQVTFTRLTSGPVGTDNADGGGSAWVDLNGDGFLDL